MKSFLQLIILAGAILFFNFNVVNAQTFNWVKSFSSTGGSVTGNSISVDANGNSYVTGSFNGIATFGTIQLSSFGSSDIFVAKFDSVGNCLWAKQAGGTDLDMGSGIAFDANMNIFVTGYFTGNATFGTTQFTSAGGTDIFLAKFDPNGNWVWAKQAGGIYADWGYGLSVDPDGNCIFTGRFIGPLTFGTFQLTGLGSWDVFIAKYDQNGNCLWAQQAGGSVSDEGYGISLDSKGKVYITGRFSGTAAFGTVHLSSYGTSDIYVANYDNNGNCLWAKHCGGTTTDRGIGIAVDENGYSYVTGWFKGISTFDTIQLSGFSNNDIFIAKYDPYGNCLWAKQAGGSNDDVGNSISVDPAGNSYVTGNFIGNVTFGAFQLTGYSGNTNDIFVAKYDSKGNCLWARQAGGTYNDGGMAISIDASGSNYLTGFFSDIAVFGANQISGGGAFISKISNDPVPVELSSFAIATVNNEVRLSWETITETNNNYFNIERKNTNGLWEIIGQIKGAGTSIIPRKYSFIDKKILSNGKYFYRLKQIDFNGQHEYSKEIEVELNYIPEEYSLLQNYPNPFNPSTTIKFSLPKTEYVTLVIFSSMGQEVSKLISKELNAGVYTSEWNASGFASGVYYYRIVAGAFTETKKLILLK
jgi:hypothetical protein